MINMPEPTPIEALSNLISVLEDIKIRKGSAFASAMGRRVSIPALRREFFNLMFGAHALQKVVDDCEPGKVLDIGSGEGLHSDAFVRHGWGVTAIDLGRSALFQKGSGHEAIVDDFNYYDFFDDFDCVWACHVLEHQLRPHDFLRKCNMVCREGGTIAVTVPPYKSEIVGGHVCLWNAGLLLYHLVLAGFDCAEAKVLEYDYNVSVIVRKRSIDILGGQVFDSGDIRRIKAFLPPSIDYRTNPEDEPFEGDIKELGWDKK